MRMSTSISSKTVLLIVDDFVAARTDEWGNGNVHVCEYECERGYRSWTNWVDKFKYGVVWDGMESCITGDAIGMLLNLDKGTLTVYKNNRRLGVIKYGLSGLYCWYTSVWGGTAVTLKREEAPRASGVAQVEYENEEYSSEIKEEDTNASADTGAGQTGMTKEIGI